MYLNWTVASFTVQWFGNGMAMELHNSYCFLGLLQAVWSVDMAVGASNVVNGTTKPAPTSLKQGKRAMGL